MKTATKSTTKNRPVKSGAEVRKKVDKFMSDGKKKVDAKAAEIRSNFQDGKKKMNAKAAAAKKNFQKGAEDFKDKVGGGLDRLGENISGAGTRLRDGK